MRISWKLGRVAGINVFLHPTFLLLVLFNPMLVQGHAILSLVLLFGAFGCVLLHELGHALAARQFGIETEDITLYPIGGVARLARMPRSPGAELVIALAGPAVNVGIAAGLGALLLFGLPLLPETPAAEVLGLVGFDLLAINVVLAAFNLLPAFPMDGGRVLRAALSGWLGRVRATQVAAFLGRALAVVFGLVAVYNVNLMGAALAGFVYLAAGAELAGVVREERRRAYDGVAGDDGIWTAPPGYRWVSQGNGGWQLVPVMVTAPGNAPRWN